VAVKLDADYYVSLSVDGPQGGTMKILAHKVKSVQEFCGSPLSTQKVCEMKVAEGLASWRFLTYDV
jgi:hypothetical protein